MKELNTTYDVASRFLSMKSVNDLCKLLDMAPRHLEWIINRPEYREFRIPKKKGGMRIISAPMPSYKIPQRTLNSFLQAVYLEKRPACSHGFICSSFDTYTIVTNARVHTNKKFVMNIDLEDFFPSISAKRIHDLFRSDVFGFNEAVAIPLSLLCTYKKQLPTGAPTSPVLSNFVCLDLDKLLTEICSERNITYTRYADDLTFSSDIYFEKDIIAVIRQAITSYGFRINEKKFRIQSTHRQQTVTGIVVNRKVNVDRKYIRNLRAILHHWDMKGLVAAAMKHLNIEHAITEIEVEQFARKIEGRINFVGQVRGRDDDIFLNLRSNFRRK